MEDVVSNAMPDCQQPISLEHIKECYRYFFLFF